MIRRLRDAALLVLAAAGVAAAHAAELATVTSAMASVPQEIAFDGVIEAINQSTVSAQTNSRVEELPFDVGDYVEKGQVIVRMRDTEQRARAQSADASIAEARARLAEAQLNFDRTRQVYERKLIAKAQLDRAAAELDSARARVAAAQAVSRETQEGVAYTVIRAPYSGIVLSREVNPGETVTVGKALMVGLSLEHLRAVVEVPQQHIGPLRQHRTARVILPDGQSLAVTEMRIPPAADPATHTFRVLVTLPAGDYGMFPGTLIKVAFVSGSQQRLLVPPSAVVRRSEVTGVYVVGRNGRVELRYVSVGTPTEDGRVPVLSGLSAGERIATDIVAAGIAYKRQAGSGA
ncbi:MAG: efflux RND transporter periplasmic adaptor subunit [Gammaproteobacteria bacterium]